MPVKNNISGIWRHLRLINAGDVTTDITADGQVYGQTGAPAAVTPLDEVVLIVESANFKSSMDVSPEALLQGTAFTKVVNIGKAQDTLQVSGPMLFTESDENTIVSDPLNLYQTHGPNNVGASPYYGDASQVAAAYLGEALNIGAGTLKPTVVENISLSLDQNGFNFDIGLKGDPTSLYPKFFDPADSTIPLGHPVPLVAAIRRASWYDFYLPITVKPVIDTIGTGAEVDPGVTIAAAIEKWTGNISIGVDEFTLIGRGQAPWYAVSSVSLSGNFTVVFPLLPEPAGAGSFTTVTPTWQAVPYPWQAENAGYPPYDGIGFGARDIVGGVPVPSPSSHFGDRPDVFTISEVGVIPRYVLNDARVLRDVSETQAIVIKDVSVNVNSGVIRADVEYEAIFLEA